MKIVINNDDFGLSYGQVDGTLFGFEHGIITSTTVLCNRPDKYLLYAAEQAKNVPEMGLGVHLTLTNGIPMTLGKTIRNSEGKSIKKNEINQNIDPEEVYQEFKAQVENFIRIFNRKPDHVDSHQNIHWLDPIRPVTERICKEYQLECRGLNSRFIWQYNLYGMFTLENFEKAVAEAIKNQYTGLEINCHCAFVDEDLFKSTSYRHQRVEELELVCSKGMKDIFDKYGLEKSRY